MLRPPCEWLRPRQRALSPALKKTLPVFGTDFRFSTGLMSAKEEAAYARRRTRKRGEKEKAMEIQNTSARLKAENANLSDSTFEDVNLSRAVFRNVKLEGATFSDICLGSVTIEDGSLSGLTIRDCHLEGMIINGILVTDLLAAYRSIASEKAAGSQPFPA